jgi:hypothetical protein
VTPAVVVLAYERPEALRRLLASVAGARYPAAIEVPLVISLDRSERPAGAATVAVARGFEWAYGAKTVVERPEHLGVVRHFRAAGGLSREHGSVVLLEDDLTVSPAYYEFAAQALGAYGESEQVAGICLYGLWFNGFTLEPFTPIDDGNDVFFLGVPHTQGLCFSAGQWEGFEAWRQEGREFAHPGLHPAFLRFGADEWFPSLAGYMAASGRVFCFPRTSLTVGWGDAGAHFEAGTSWFQTPIQLGQRAYQLPEVGSAAAVYDGFFELRPERLQRLAPALEGVEFEVDLNATKRPENLHGELVLTTRPTLRAESSYGLEMYPPEANVIAGVTGTGIALARREDVRWDAWAETEARRRLHEYAWRRYRPSRKRALRFAAARYREGLRSVAATGRRLLGRGEPDAGGRA